MVHMSVFKNPDGEIDEFKVIDPLLYSLVMRQKEYILIC